MFHLEFYQLIAIKTEHSHLTTRNGVTAMCLSGDGVEFWANIGTNMTKSPCEYRYVAACEFFLYWWISG